MSILEAPLYKTFANVVKQGDCILSFNYAVALENELIGAAEVSDQEWIRCELSSWEWDEPDSQVTLLKLHGSVNWIALLFGGVTTGFSACTNSIGQLPFVDNVDSLLAGYSAKVLDTTFQGGAVASGATSLVLPTYEMKIRDGNLAR